MPKRTKTKAEPASVCLIGNSHIAALKQAWSNRPPKVAAGFSATFFSAQNRMMEHLAVEGRALVPQRSDLAEKLSYTSGGIQTIEVDSYNAFVLVGSGFGIDLEKFSAIGGTPAHLRWKKVEPLLSEACFDAVIATHLRDSLLIGVLRMIRSIAPSPVLIAAAPFLSERVLEDPPLDTDERFHDAEFLAPFVARCRKITERVAAEFGSTVVWQDETTISEKPGFTKLEYGLGPARFAMRGGKTPEFDRRHGNEDYGALLLAHVLAKLDTMLDGRVLPKKKAA